MKHKLSFFVILISILSLSKMNATSNIPDFSFPKDVIHSADSTLNVALKNGDSNGIIRSLIQYSIAESSISEDNIQSIITKIDSIANLEKNAVTKAILYSIEAEIYNLSPARRDAQRSDIIELESNTYPRDITEWSDSHYTRKIKELLDKSLSNDDQLKATPTQDYRDVINYNTEGILYEPTIYDFLSHRAMNIIARSNDDLNDTKNKISNSLLEFNKNNPAQYIYTTLKIEDILNNTDSLYTLYNRFKDSEHCALILSKISNYDRNPNIKLHGLLKEYIAKFPNSFLIAKVKNTLKYCEAIDIKIKAPQTSTSNKPIEIELIAANTNKYKITIYRIPDDIKQISQQRTPLSKLQLIETKEFNNSNTIPFCDTIKATFNKLNYGRYIIVPNCKLNNGQNLEDSYKQNYLSILSVSDIKLITINNNIKTTDIIAVSAIDGAPLKDVKLQNVNSSTTLLNLKTDKNGVCPIDLKEDRYRSIIGTKGNDLFSENIYIQSYQHNNSSNYNGSILTDLGVYKPGDSINVVAVCFYNQKLATQQKIKIKLKNPNYEDIEMHNLITDDFGRISTSFKLPKDGLNGQYIIALSDNTKDNSFSSKSIQVSEYKAPSFKVEFIDFKSNYNLNDSINIKGVVKSFSGIALSGINVDLEFNKMQWAPFRFFNKVDKFVETFKLTTNAKGEFSITLPTSLIIENKDDDYNQVRVDATATSLAGETQQCSNLFLLNNFSKLSITEDLSFNLDSTIKLPINISEKKPFTCEYKIYNSDDVAVHSGSFNSINYTINLSTLPSGKYKLSARLVNDPISKDSKEIILYHTKDLKSPVESPLWIPTTDVQCDKNNVALITIGNSTPKSNIYYVASTDNSTIGSGWIYYNQGMHQFRLKIPQSTKGDVKIKFITTQDNNTTTKEVNVKTNIADEKISIVCNSFRDKVIPNSLEKWSFKVINNDSIAKQAAFIAEMFDNAINSIQGNEWKLYEPKYKIGYSNFRFNHNNFSLTQQWIEKITSSTLPKIEYPALNLYNQRFIFSGNYSIMYKNSFTGRASNNLTILRESNSMDLAEVEDVAVLAKGARSSTSDAEKSPVISYRLNDVKTAFWKPMLTTDKNGNIVIEFMVPENNTTWLFQAVAYTSNMLETSISKEVLANKPIMVKPNLPRFLRHGDNATISAQVLNATDSIENCKVEIQLYNISTDEVLLTENFDATIPAKSDRNFDIQWCIPDTISFLGYRIKASNNAFGDGEQSLIAILPATSPVIESKPFFIDDKVKSYTLELPKYPANSVITFEYCDNPVWYCVTAIPSMQSVDAITANGISSTIFTNLMAKGILKKYPAIKSALDSWKSNSNNTNLTSMLSKNEELKNVNLKNTPWLPQAQKENILMSQLASFTDNDKINAATTKAITMLKELQTKDGGWGWYKGCESSPRITYEIMQNLGYLKNLGFHEDDATINTIIANGIKYIDNNLIEIMKDKQPYNSRELLPYMFLRSMFSEIPLSATLAQFKNSALVYAENNWKKLSMADKAFASIALTQNGKINTAKKIVESLRQFSITKPSTGMYWDNIKSGSYFIYNNVALTSLMLQAFNTVEPKCADIDQIRKWLLLQKQTTNWGTYSMAGDAVYSILSTGTNWINDNSNKAVITLNSTPITIDSIASHTGYIKQTININPNINNTISIARSGDNPAWGSLFGQYTAPMKSLTSKSIEGLSIEKELYKNIDGKLKKVSNFKVGDKVTVRFTIKASRDLDYVNLTDERSACIEPVEQLSGITYGNGMTYYKDIKNDATNLYFATINKGTHIIDYEVYITAPGTYNLGIATIQCQYAPQMVTTSAGNQITATK